jgi:hypothetical protein
MFGLVILGSSATFAPNYTRTTVAAFSTALWANISNTPAASLTLDQYQSGTGAAVPGYCYVVRSDGEPTSGWNYTYYYVTGTKAEIAALNASITPILNATEEIRDCVNRNASVAFVILKSVASEDQTMTFWVNIVVWILFIGFAVSAFLIWHTDNYPKDPRNSLLFVTDGNRLVTGE